MARTDQQQGVSLDLDVLEREDDPGPFTFQIGGEVYELRDPQSMDYRDLIDIIVKASNADLVGALSLAIGEDDAESFFENRIPAFKLNALLDRFLEHYGLEPAGEADASSPSSNGTARRSKRTSRSKAST